MNVSLTPELEKLVASKVASGLYLSASEVVREGLRLLGERDALNVERRKEVHAKIREGLTELNRGDYTDYDAVSLDRRVSEIKSTGRARRKSAWNGKCSPSCSIPHRSKQ